MSTCRWALHFAHIALVLLRQGFFVAGPQDLMQIWPGAARYPVNRMVLLGGTARVLIEERLCTCRKTRLSFGPRGGSLAAEAESGRSEASN